MAWANSFVPSATFRDALSSVITFDPGSDTINIALFNNSLTPSIDTDPLTYLVTPWVTGDEVTGTNWSAGGVALTSPAVTLVSGSGIKFDADDVSVASTTISSGAYGALIYDDTLSPKCGLVAVYFGGTGYTTNNGTFGITWDASGIYTVQLH